MLPHMPIHFERTPQGWFAQGAKYEMRREGRRVGERFTLFIDGRREVSFFAWVDQTSGLQGPEYNWTIGASQGTAQTSVGVETYATLFGAFFAAYQRQMSLPPGSLTISFDPGIEDKAWERRGP
ncbi:hypothetical protein DAH56_06555 [Sphingomonas koreensis]|nr:hypothetical protein DAH56_06555 [Sphingomonas koreensis]